METGREVAKRADRKAKIINDPSRTKQSFGKSTRVDSILRKYATLGVDAQTVGLFGATVARMPFGVADLDYDFQEHHNRVQRVQEYFRSLPSAVRDRFKNSPAIMFEFISDPANRQEAIDLGLLEGEVSKPPAAPTTVPAKPA